MQCDSDNAAWRHLEGKLLRMIKLALGLMTRDNAADDEISGNAADDGKGTCLAAMSLMVHDLAGVPAFALCDRAHERTALRAKFMILYTMAT